MHVHIHVSKNMHVNTVILRPPHIAHTRTRAPVRPQSSHSTGRQSIKVPATMRLLSCFHLQ